MLVERGAGREVVDVNVLVVVVVNVVVVVAVVLLVVLVVVLVVVKLVVVVDEDDGGVRLQASTASSQQSPSAERGWAKGKTASARPATRPRAGHAQRHKRRPCGPKPAVASPPSQMRTKAKGVAEARAIDRRALAAPVLALARVDGRRCGARRGDGLLRRDGHRRLRRRDS